MANAPFGFKDLIAEGLNDSFLGSSESPLHTALFL